MRPALRPGAFCAWRGRRPGVTPHIRQSMLRVTPSRLPPHPSKIAPASTEVRRYWGMMHDDFAFYIAAAVAIVATFMVITRLNAIHALLYFVVSLLAAALILLLLGAPFAAAMEVIIYAGAIMVLFVFVVMILSTGPRGALQERQWLRASTWIGPALLCRRPPRRAFVRHGRRAAARCRAPPR